MLDRKQKLQRIIQLGLEISQIQDLDVLLEKVLTEAKNLVNADAGSLYIIEETGTAVSGYNLMQMIATGEKLLPVIKPSLVILGIYTEGFNRINNPFVYFHGFSLRSSKYEFARISGDKLYLLHVKNSVLQNIELYLLKYCKLYNFVLSKLIQIKNRPAGKNDGFVRSNEFIQASEQIVTFNDFLKSNHIKLIVLPIIQHNRNGIFEDATIDKKNQLVILCNKNHIPVVDLFNVLNNGENLWINNDAHWNERAHYLAAKSLATLILENKLCK